MNRAADPAGDLLYRSVLVLGTAVLLLNAAGLGPLRDQLWGSHTYAFFPAWVFVIGAAALIAIAAHVMMRGFTLPALTLPKWAGHALRALGAAAFFWLARIRHALLGDANSLSQNLPNGEHFHPDSPLTLLAHQVFYRLTRALFAHVRFEPGTFWNADAATAFATVGLGSAICGGLFALVAWALAGEMLAARPQAGASADPKSEPLRWLLFLVLMGQGYALLFCGYVENYTYLLFTMAAYLWLALRHLRGGALFWPGLALMFAVAWHLMAAILGPSFLVMAWLALARRERRVAAIRDLALLAAALAALLAFLAWVGGGYNLFAHLFQMIHTAGTGEVQQDHVGMFAPEHWRDFLSEQLLIGPLGFLLLVPAAAWVLRGGRWREPAALVLLVAAGLCALMSWVTRDLRLGYGRDWYLFAPYGMVMSVFALYVFASGARAAARLQSSLALAVAVSLFTTLPWIALNTSWDRSFARLKTLPLGRGRTEGVVGYWYGQRKDYANAHAWLDRSLEIYPGNLSSTIISGYFYLQEGKFLDGAKSFYMATRLRPSFMSYRVRLVDALVRAGQPEAAVTEAETLVEKWPTNAQAFAMYGIALHGVGRVDEARAALGGAIQMAPNEVAYRGALANLAIEGGYELTLKTLWQRVAGE